MTAIAGSNSRTRFHYKSPHALRTSQRRLAGARRSGLFDSSLKLWVRPSLYAFSDAVWIDSSVSGTGVNLTATVTTDLKGKRGILCPGTGSKGTGSANIGIFGNAAFSFALWLEFKSTSDGGVFGWGDTGVALAATGLIMVSAQPYLAFAGSNNVVPPAVTTGRYYCIVVTKEVGAANTTNTKIYYDGVAQSCSSSGGGTPNITNAAPYFGQWGNYTAGYANILISQGMIWNRALPPGEVKTVYELLR